MARKTDTLSTDKYELFILLGGIRLIYEHNFLKESYKDGILHRGIEILFVFLKRCYVKSSSYKIYIFPLSTKIITGTTHVMASFYTISINEISLDSVNVLSTKEGTVLSGLVSFIWKTISKALVLMITH